MGTLLRRYLNPIGGLFQWLHLVSITFLALVDKDVLPAQGCNNCLQGWSLLQQKRSGVERTFSPHTDVGCGAVGSFEELQPGRKQSALLRSMGAPERQRRGISGHQTETFQNLRGGYQEDSARLFTIVPLTLSWCLSQYCEVKSCLGTTNGCSPPEPPAHLCCRWTLYSRISLEFWPVWPAAV